MSIADVPRTRAELEGLFNKRSELSGQLGDLRGRREALVVDASRAPEGDRPAIQERIAGVDRQMVRLENEVDRINELVAAAPPRAMVAVAPRPPEDIILTRLASDIVPLIAILTVFVFAPIALAIARFLWKRSTAPRAPKALGDQAAMQRLDHLQQSIDTIAIEVERISEGQRFVSKVLSEKERLPARSSAEP